MSVNIKQNGELNRIANNFSIVQANWDATDDTNGTFIRNKPETVTTLEEVSASTNDTKDLVSASVVKELNDGLTSKTVDISIIGTGATVDTSGLKKVGNIVTGTIILKFTTNITVDYVAEISGSDKPKQEIVSYGYIDSSTVSRIKIGGATFTFNNYGKTYQSGWSVMFPITWAV